MELHALDFSLALTRDNPSNHRGPPFAHTQHQRGYLYLGWLWHSLTSFPKSAHWAWWKDAPTPAGGCGGCLRSFGGGCGTGFKIENIHNFVTQQIHFLASLIYFLGHMKVSTRIFIAVYLQ